MWFGHFRTAPDYDLYVKPSFIEMFLAANPNFRQTKRDARKLVGFIGKQKIDMTTDTEGSWVGYVMKANESSQHIDFHNLWVSLATPTTLRLIKEVLACWRLNWRKHIADYVFLNGLVKEAYSPEELEAFRVGMTNFERFYPYPGVPIALEKRLYTILQLEEIVNIADLPTRIGIKDNIVDLLCGEMKW